MDAAARDYYPSPATSGYPTPNATWRCPSGAALAAVCFAAVAATNALSNRPTLQQREFLREMMARQGLSIHVPPAPGFNWAGTVIPGAIAVLLVVLIIFLRVTRADRP